MKLHTYAAVPSVLLIDDLDNYFTDETIKNDSVMHIARTCALIFHSMKSCSRILKMNVSEKLYIHNTNKFILCQVREPLFKNKYVLKVSKSTVILQYYTQIILYTCLLKLWFIIVTIFFSSIFTFSVLIMEKFQ